MSPAFLRCVAGVLQVEAGYQCSRVDRGNWSGGEVGAGVLIGTNRGISAPVLAHWRKTPVSADDMRALTRDEALAIYEALYWVPLQGDALPLALAYVCFDSAVNSGFGSRAKPRTVAWLQAALGVQLDSAIGPLTLAAARACDVVAVVKGFCCRRLAFLQADPDWVHFGRGWQARVDRVQIVALNLLEP